MRRLIDSIKKTNLVCKQLAPECAAVNSRRTVYGSIAAIIVHAAHVVIYSLTIPHNGNEVIWHNGIVTTHSVMLAVMGIMLIYALMLRRRKKAGMPEYILQYLLISLLMAEGVVLTYFDQFITPSVTPYIILCLVSGIVFLMRPIYSLLIFALSYAAFFYAVGLEHIVRNVVLSNRTNGFAIASIGFGISYVMWRYNLLHIRQRSHIEAQQKKLMDMANLDPLTGLFNRRKFDEIIRQEIAFSTLSKRESSLIMLDIDFFKNINDSYGHPAGDSVLMQFSRLLKESIAGNDQI
jgi:predicted signal transduction protein with EAL and GGDEF domain